MKALRQACYPGSGLQAASQGQAQSQVEHHVESPRLTFIALIPLPFVSYGGSSLITYFALVGVVQSVHMRRMR